MIPIIQFIFPNLWHNWLGERQDRRVVITQRPKSTDLRMGEKLIQGEGPIIEYQRRRRVMIDTLKG